MRSVHSWLLLVFASIGFQTALFPSASFAEPDRYYPTEMDLMTDHDYFYFRFLNPDPAVKRVSNWPVVKDVMRIGADAIDAHMVAERLHCGLPVGDQPGFQDIRQAIDECAAKLGIDPPKLFVEANPKADAYVARLREPRLLVMSSRMIKLYEKFPEELKFIIGNELGHIRCNHIRLKAVSDPLMAFLTDDRTPGKIRDSWITPIAVSQLLRWHRAAEMSADRAGLLCVDGNLDIAKRALLRLQHGTDRHVVPEIVEQEFLSFEQEPLAEIVRKIRSRRSDHPHVMDRCLALERWTKTNHYRTVRYRTSEVPVDKRLVIDGIKVTGLPDTDRFYDKECDSYVVASIANHEYRSETLWNANNPRRTKLAWSAPFVPNARVLVQVWDENRLWADTLMGTSLITFSEAGGETPFEFTTDLWRQGDNADTPKPKVAITYHFESDK